MSKKKSKFTAIDFILIFVILVIVASVIFRNTSISQFNKVNSVRDSVVTVSLKAADKSHYEYFKTGDNIYVNNDTGYYKFGEIKNIRTAPAVYSVMNGDKYELAPDFTKIDIVMEINTDCLFDERGFISIKQNYIAPGCKLSADNGKIKFNFEVVSVKTIDR